VHYFESIMLTNVSRIDHGASGAEVTGERSNVIGEQLP
jgi:hypothetical protein